MSTYLSFSAQAVKLKSYSAVTRGGKTVLRVDLEVADPMELGFLLKELAEFGPKVARHERRVRSAGQLLLTHRPEGGE